MGLNGRFNTREQNNEKVCQVMVDKPEGFLYIIENESELKKRQGIPVAFLFLNHLIEEGSS